MRKACQGRKPFALFLFAGIERSWTVADESPGGTETMTTTILNEIPEMKSMYENDRA